MQLLSNVVPTRHKVQIILNRGSYTNDHFISNLSNKPYEMIMSVRFCLSYDLLNAISSPSKFVYFNENLHCCNGRYHDVTCSRQNCYVRCGHNITFDMTFSTE